MFAMDYRLAQGKVNQLRAEAEKDRRSRMAKEGGFERLVQSVGQGLLRIGERPRRQRLHRHAI
jgi:hypothetical protein